MNDSVPNDQVFTKLPFAQDMLQIYLTKVVCDLVVNDIGGAPFLEHTSRFVGTLEEDQGTLVSFKIPTLSDAGSDEVERAEENHELQRIANSARSLLGREPTSEEIRTFAGVVKQNHPTSSKGNILTYGSLSRQARASLAERGLVDPDSRIARVATDFTMKTVKKVHQAARSGKANEDVPGAHTLQLQPLKLGTFRFRNSKAAGKRPRE